MWKPTTMAILVMALSTVSAAAGEAADEKVQRVSVCMNTVGQDVFLAGAMAVKMFAAIGVKLEWHALRSCPKGSLGVFLGSNTPEDRFRGTLAYAAYEGYEITVFYDRVRKQHRGSPAAVLAHVLVHEITHVLQGVPHHSERGVMKAHWEPGDFSAMVFRPLPFSVEDVDLIRRGLVQRDVTQRALAAAHEAE